jgi:hypothetical protein
MTEMESQEQDRERTSGNMVADTHDFGEIISVSFAALVLDLDLQIRRTGTDPTTVKRYATAMAAGVEFPPPVVVPIDPQDTTRGYILIDGWHRVEAMQSNGRKEATVKVLANETDRRRWKWLATTANLRHGRALSRGDRRECFRAYVRAGEARDGGRRGAVKSARQMTRELGGNVSHPTLLKWMKADFPKTYARMNSKDRETVENPTANFGITDPNEDIARVASAGFDQVRAAFNGLAAQEWRDVVIREAQRLVKELVAALPNDYSDTDAPWRELALPDAGKAGEIGHEEPEW